MQTKWRQIYHDFGNRYHGPNRLAFWRRLLLGHGDEVGGSVLMIDYLKSINYKIEQPSNKHLKCPDF